MDVTTTAIAGNDANVGGGLWNIGTLTLTDTTIANNRAMDGGGGLWNGWVNNASGVVTLTNTTVAGNDGEFGGGGGIANYSGTVALQNTLLAPD